MKGWETTETYEVSPAPQEPPLLDQSVIDGIREIDGSGDELLTRVVGLYLEHAPRAFVWLEGLVQSGAAPGDCASAAHALKSLSRNAGAKLAKADLLDGKADKIVTRCASCALGMDGKAEHSLKALDYTMYFCTAGCAERFAKNMTESIEAMEVPDK